MKMTPLLVLDVETTGLKPDYHEVVQLAAIVYDPVTLERVSAEEGGEFDSLLRPLHEDRIDEGALRVNKLTREQLREAPHPEAVWLSFLAFIKRHNVKGGPFSAPMACGKNIRRFDLPFLYNLSAKYSPKGEKQTLFHREQIDLEDIIRQWFWWNAELPSMSLDTLRTYFGMSTASSHTARGDVIQTGEMIAYFMRLTRELNRKYTTRGEPLLDFKAAFKGL